MSTLTTPQLPPYKSFPRKMTACIWEHYDALTCTWAEYNYFMIDCYEYILNHIHIFIHYYNFIKGTHQFHLREVLTVPTVDPHQHGIVTLPRFDSQRKVIEPRVDPIPLVLGEGHHAAAGEPV